MHTLQPPASLVGCLSLSLSPPVESTASTSGGTRGRARCRSIIVVASSARVTPPTCQQAGCLRRTRNPPTCQRAYRQQQQQALRQQRNQSHKIRHHLLLVMVEALFSPLSPMLLQGRWAASSQWLSSIRSTSPRQEHRHPLPPHPPSHAGTQTLITQGWNTGAIETWLLHRQRGLRMGAKKVGGGSGAGRWTL